MKNESPMGLLELIFIILFILKIFNVITISWFFVFAPLYPALFIWTLVLIIGIVSIFLKKRKKDGK